MSSLIASRMAFPLSLMAIITMIFNAQSGDLPGWYSSSLPPIGSRLVSPLGALPPLGPSQPRSDRTVSGMDALDKMHQQLDSANAMVRQLMTKNKQQERMIREKGAMIMAKDEAIQSKDYQIEAQDSMIAANCDLISALKEEIDAKEEVINAQSLEIEVLQRSLSDHVLPDVVTQAVATEDTQDRFPDRSRTRGRRNRRTES